MTAIFRFLQGTPWWVFVVFAVLVWLGVQALRPRVLALPRVFLTPAVFIGWGVVNLVVAANAAPFVLLDWLLTAVAGAALALATTGIDGMRVDRDHGLVHLPASWLPLLRILLIFAAKYAIAAIGTVRPELHGALLPWDIAVSGLSAGYFLGWTTRFVRRYRRVADVDLLARSSEGAA